MKKKIIITENQLKVITNLLAEDTDHSTIVKDIVKHLSTNYKKAIETYRDGNEYNQKKVFEIIADGQLISGEDLLKYFKLRYNHGVGFLMQVINDWCDGYPGLEKGMLSKNISLRN